MLETLTIIVLSLAIAGFSTIYAYLQHLRNEELLQMVENKDERIEELNREMRDLQAQYNARNGERERN